ncbi:hypothetical protein Y032_0122g1051 [Ancylostoma ceylanicum]|nr:hypothetical protein Y032_0122g1051 [Ancylostoma ceylanicum]
MLSWISHMLLDTNPRAAVDAPKQKYSRKSSDHFCTHPAQLKDDVQSPGGSSVYGMHKLESGGLKGLLMDAVEAATSRSRATGDKALPRDIRNTELL